MFHSWHQSVREIRETENFLNKFISCHKNSVYWPSYMYIRDRAMVSYIKVNLKTNFAVCLVLLECRLILLEHFLTHFLKNKRVFFLFLLLLVPVQLSETIGYVMFVAWLSSVMVLSKLWKCGPLNISHSASTRVFWCYLLPSYVKYYLKSQHFPPFKTQKEKLCTDDMCMCPLIYHRRELIKVRE